MKILITTLLVYIGLTCHSQPPVSTSLEQGVTLQLLDIAVVERVSTEETTSQTSTETVAIRVQAADKWKIETKKIRTLKNFFSVRSPSFENQLARINPLESADLYTLTKP